MIRADARRVIVTIDRQLLVRAREVARDCCGQHGNRAFSKWLESVIRETVYPPVRQYELEDYLGGDVDAK